MKKSERLPLIYSCSGCSNVAQLANAVALELQARNVGQMSCIAGVGGGVKGLVQMAQSGRTIVVLDGCPLHCSAACLNQVGVRPDIHLTLTEHGNRKRTYTQASPEQVDQLCTQVLGELDNLRHPRKEPAAPVFTSPIAGEG